MADVVPYIAIRSQGFNAARELVGWQSLLIDTIWTAYHAFSITPDTKTLKGYQLAKLYFTH
jgi:hypothetical protein